MIDISASDKSFLDSYLNGKSFIFTTLIDNVFAEMGENWFINLKKLGHGENTLIISLDKKCDEYFKEKNIPSIFLKSSTVWEEDLLDVNIEQRKETGYDNLFKKISLVSFLIKEYKLDVILSHVDIVYLKDPILKLNNEFKEHDLLINNNRKPVIDILKKGRRISNKENSYNEITKSFFSDSFSENDSDYFTDLSFFCIKSNDKTHKVIDLLQEHREKILSQKDYFSFNQTVSDFMKKTGLKYKFLSPVLFLNGYYLDYNRFDDKSLFKKIIDNAYILHYTMIFNEELDWTNFEERKLLKIDKMKANKHWFL